MKQKVHFIGIGGAGMSAIAKVLLTQGYQVSGSDLKESRYTKALQELGAQVFIGHARQNLNSPDLVVISSAIPAHNAELVAAKKQNLPILSRAEMLGQIVNQKETVAVAGTHGKTTTTSLIAYLLQTAGLEPTFLIGGELNDIGSNAFYGHGRYCVVEADESDGSLINIKPKIEVITNLDTDHLDHYHSFDHLVETFKLWTSFLPPDGLLIVNEQVLSYEGILSMCRAPVITYGAGKQADYYYETVELSGFSSQFKVFTGSKCLGSFKLNIPGVHNIENAVAAVALSQHLNIDIKVVYKALSTFTGVKRRWHLVGKSRGISIIDDYAHHPTEIKAIIKAAKNGLFSRIIFVFQPHRYTRTQLLAQEYRDCFQGVDLLVLTDVYGAGEDPLPGISGKTLVDQVCQSLNPPRLAYIPDKLQIKDYLMTELKSGDLVLTVGAGDVWMVGYELLNLLVET